MKSPFLLFLLVFGVGLVVSPKIGVAWDEPDNIFSGGVYWNFFRGGAKARLLNTTSSDSSYFGSFIYPQDRSLARYPPFHNYLGTALAIGAERLGAPRSAETAIVSFHVATTIFFGILVATTYRFGRLLGLSSGTSFFAALATFLYPTIFGHGFSNLKDTAQAAMFTMSLFYLVRRNILKGSIIWGLALATKFNAIYVPIIWGIGEIREIGGIKKIFFVVCVGLAVAFLVWPYLWFDPVGRATEVVVYFTNVNTAFKNFRFFWNGTMYQTGVGKSLWWYPWGYVLVGTPIPLLFLVVIGGIGAIREWKKYGILLIWLVVPMLRAVLPGAILYDGLRHFLEVIPAFVLLSAVGLEEACLPAGRLGKLVRLGIVAHLVFINITLFPYSSGYYNVLARGANENFDRDIESLSVREAMDWLHVRYKNLKVWSPIAGHLAWYLIKPGDVYVYSAEEADSIILVNKSSHIRKAEFEKELHDTFQLDHVVRRGNAVFAWIYRKR